jgi:hypothetical protein
MIVEKQRECRLGGETEVNFIAFEKSISTLGPREVIKLEVFL